MILYRRRFPPHKYLVVSLVTLGITLFMFLGKEGPSSKHVSSATEHKGKGQEGLIGMALLIINLLIDGATNSGQDEIFRRFKVSGESLGSLENGVPLGIGGERRVRAEQLR